MKNNLKACTIKLKTQSQINRFPHLFVHCQSFNLHWISGSPSSIIISRFSDSWAKLRLTSKKFTFYITFSCCMMRS